MLKECELDEIRAEKELAFLHNQAAKRKHKEIKKQAEIAYEERQLAWDDEMGAEVKVSCEKDIGFKDAHQQIIWDECENACASIYGEIDILRRDALAEHFAMKKCFKKANFERKHGDMVVADRLADEGREHRLRHNELIQEIRSLLAKIKDAEKNAERLAPQTNKVAFERSKTECGQAKERYYEAEAKHEQLKKERDTLKKECDIAQRDYPKISGIVQKEEKTVSAIDDCPLDVFFTKNHKEKGCSQYSWWQQIIFAASKIK